MQLALKIQVATQMNLFYVVFHLSIIIIKLHLVLEYMTKMTI